MANKLSALSRDPRSALGVASLALVVGTFGAVSGSEQAPSVAAHAPREAGALAPRAVDAGVSQEGKRFNVSTDVELAAGASVTAAGTVALGARLVEVSGCVGRYDATTRICILSPGPWELHSACYERTGVDASTQCEVLVRNAGTLPMKFDGYVEVLQP